MADRVFLIVLDSVGIGEMPDAKDYGDEGSNTLKACFDTGNLHVPNMKKMGLFNIEGNEYGGKVARLPARHEPRGKSAGGTSTARRKAVAAHARAFQLITRLSWISRPT